MVRQFGFPLGIAVALGLLTAGPVHGSPPAQRLPSAVLVYPTIIVEGGGLTTDTRVELLNLSSRDINVRCFYVTNTFCSGVGFFLRLTPNQPMSWLVSRGAANFMSGTWVPAFQSSGELKCAVIPDQPELEAHNAIQGRAIIFSANGETLGYGAVGFQRLSPGDFSGTVALDGSTYAQCPDEMHFVVLASDPADPDTQSEIVLTPCSQDLANVIPTTTTVQLLVINEFEQVLSASTTVECFARRTLSDISHAFDRNTLGTDVGQLIVRGVQNPVMTMVIDRFVTSQDIPAAAANEPVVSGGRPATIRFP